MRPANDDRKCRSARMSSGRVGLLLGALALGLLLAASLAPPVRAKTVWLCRPGKVRNPCVTGLNTTLLSPKGKIVGTRRVRRIRHPKVDCFYLYPTVSEQATRNSNLKIEAEQRSVARMQAARYSQRCRVFAPMYRQQTLAALESPEPITPAESRLAYRSALHAWRQYMRRYNHGRGFVLIGHSQGSEVLRKLISEQIDGKPKLRRRMLSALLMGGNVEVREGGRKGGDFSNVAACRSRRQVGCVVAFSVFNAAVPPDAAYGRVGGPFNPGNPLTRDVLCTNPASLDGGRRPLDSIYPSGFDFGLALTGVPQPGVRTPWIEFRGAYSGRCTDFGDADVLRISSLRGAPVLNPLPDSTWGLHLIDANVALGNLVGLVRSQTETFLKQRFPGRKAVGPSRPRMSA